MTKIETPIANERTKPDAEIGSVAGMAADMLSVAPLERPRIRYGYWAGAIVAGLAIWIAAFALAR